MPVIDFDATIDLTDSEWMSLISGERDLQRCCANISELRDRIIEIARDGGRYHTHSLFFLRAYRAAADGHDIHGIPALNKIRDACLEHIGIAPAEFLAGPHADRDYVE